MHLFVAWLVQMPEHGELQFHSLRLRASNITIISAWPLHAFNMDKRMNYNAKLQLINYRQMTKQFGKCKDLQQISSDQITYNSYYDSSHLGFYHVFLIVCQSVSIVFSSAWPSSKLTACCLSYCACLLKSPCMQACLSVFICLSLSICLPACQSFSSVLKCALYSWQNWHRKRPRRFNVPWTD